MMFVVQSDGSDRAGKLCTDDLGAGSPLGKLVSKQAGLLCNSIYFWTHLPSCGYHKHHEIDKARPVPACWNPPAGSRDFPELSWPGVSVSHWIWGFPCLHSTFTRCLKSPRAPPAAGGGWSIMLREVVGVQKWLKFTCFSWGKTLPAAFLGSALTFGELWGGDKCRSRCLLNLQAIS